LENAICHHRAVALTGPFAQQGEYWFAGVLTVIAAVVVTVVMLITSRSDKNNTR
jgi:hypothetical protein